MRYDMLGYRTLRPGMMSCGLVQHGALWHAVECYDMIRYGTQRPSMECYDMVRYSTQRPSMECYDMV